MGTPHELSVEALKRANGRRTATEIKWIKLAANLFDNRKIRQIESLPDGDTLIVIWLKLLTLAGQTNDGGCVYFTPDIPYTDQLLATQFNRPLPTIQLALRTFEQFHMITIIDDLIKVTNWERYQSVDKMTEIREYNRLAQQRSREKRRLLLDVNDKSMTGQPSQDTDIDIDIDKDIDKEKSIEKSRRFVPPSVEDVRSYCIERRNNVDAGQFWDFYQAKGWMVGKNHMKDWRAAVRTWEKNKRTGANGIKLSNETDDPLDGIL